MKKSTKKHLMLLVAIIALMSAAIFAMPMASAVAECGCESPILVDGTVVNPTCTTSGYTEKVCSIHKDIVLGRDNIKAPLQHNFDEWKYEKSENGDYYVKFRTCQRSGCGIDSFESTGTELAKYYKVSFANPWVTDTVIDYKYTQLADTYKTKNYTFDELEAYDNVFEGEFYVKEGDKAVFLSEEIPYRSKDKAFGAYTFAGWDVNLDSITANTTANAVFEGVKNVDYTVKFFSEAGNPISKELTIRHGEGIDDSLIRPLAVKESTEAYVYTFNGWDVDISAIYGTTGVIATYQATPQMYKFGFYKYDGTPFYGPDGAQCIETCPYGGSSAVGMGIPAADIERPGDLTYIYSWTGEWQLKNRPGYIIDIKNGLTVPKGTDPEVEEVQLTPVYTRKLKVYDIKVVLNFPSDIAENAPGFYGDTTVIQITNAAGQLIASGETKVKYRDINGESVPYIEFDCQANYSSTYYVTAVTYDYKYNGEAQSLYIDEFGPTQVTVNMGINPDFESKCGCICHNVLLRPLWARILNIIYNLFGKKIVCCYDMYATLGDLLAYTK